MEEIWRDIEGYEGFYQVSNLGNVKSLNYQKRGYEKNLTPKINNSGRLWVELARDGIKRQFQIHRLVGMAFISNPLNLPQINHLDENPKNNRVDNLEWCTNRYNKEYTMRRHHDKYPYFNGLKERRPAPVRRNGKRTHLPVLQLTKDGELIKQWPNVTTVKYETGWSDWSISECCRGNRKTAYGFKWQYAV